MISVIVKLLELEAITVAISEISSSCLAMERLSSRDSGTF